MVKAQSLQLSLIAKEQSNRFDVDFLMFQALSEKRGYLGFSTLFDVVEKEKVKVPEEFKYCEIGHVEKTGDIDPVLLNENQRDELNENFFKKIEKGDIISPNVGDILLSSVRPNLKKFVYIDEEKKDVFFTKAFIHLRPKKNGLLLYYMLRSVFFNNIIFVSRQGKGYPTLKNNDLLCLNFDKLTVEKVFQNKDKLIPAIKEMEKEIKQLKLKFRKPQEIIDEVFAEEFNFNWQKVFAEDADNSFVLHTSEIHKNNRNLRSGYRWHKLQRIQKLLYEGRKDITKLGSLILKTKNGWSPQCSENGDGAPVLGVDAIKNNATLNFDNPKFTNETRQNIKEFYISKDDFFVSRGNTIDLVALAGVVEALPDQDTIFPDLFIRVRLNKKSIDHRYLAFLFNSSVGRLYFKYSAKGKNQTMVKISSLELENFDIPLPSLLRQGQIVSKIRTKLEEQEAKRAGIEQKREEIEQIIEKVLEK